MTLTLSLEPTSTEPLYKQLERLIREAIQSGKLKPGDRIPSVTDLAKRAKVNRATVVGAFQELERGGLIVSYVGRGTYVLDGSTATAIGSPLPEAHSRAGMIGSNIRELLALKRPEGTINLAAGVPDPGTVQDGLLERLVRETVAKNPRRLIEYGGPAGIPEIREAIAGRLNQRGTRIQAEQVLVTNGSQQAITVLAAWALEQNRLVACETPTFTGVPGAFSLFGHKVESVAWEADRLALGPMQAGRRLLYCCPEHHNPTGQCLSLTARREIADLAQRTDCVVVADEIFRDLRFRGEPPPSLYDLLPGGRRILVGSISKSFMTGLRVGYIVADAELISQMLPAKRYLDLGGPALTQAVAATFLRNGYDDHVAGMRRYYKERAEAAVAALEKAMPPGTAFTRPDGGFQLWVTLPPGLSSIQLYLRALEQRVAISPGPAHDIGGRYLNCFRIGYGHAGPSEIREAIARLGAIARTLTTVETGREVGISP